LGEITPMNRFDLGPGFARVGMSLRRRVAGRFPLVAHQPTLTAQRIRLQGLA
jgi:hypothetical protein